MRALRWLDRRLWLLPLLAGVAGAVLFFLIMVRPGSSDPFASVSAADLRSFMSSLAGTGGSLLGLDLAAVSILVAMPKAHTAPIARARTRIAAALLSEALLLAVILGLSTYLIIASTTTWITIVLLAAMSGAGVGFVVVGAAFALAVWEAGR